MRTSMPVNGCIVLLLVTAGSGCLGPATNRTTDGGPNLDSGLDAGVGDDAGADAGAETDAGIDSGTEIDAGVDAGTEVDAGVDAGSEPVDAGIDAGLLFDVDGPISYTTHTDYVTHGNGTYTITTTMPSTSGSHPLVSFWCGTQQAAAGYAPYAKRLASYGIAMSIVDDPGILVSTDKIVPTAIYLVDTWIASRFGGSVDLAHIGLSGHSRGASVTIFAADQGLRGKTIAWLGLDAVDNPLQHAVLARTVLPNIAIPNGFLGAAVATDCAPTSANYVTLFPLAPSPSVLVAFNGANHTQFEAPDGCFLCGLCMPGGTADQNVVLARSVRYFTAFFARELLGDTRVGAAFEGAGAAADSASGGVTISTR